MRTSVKMKFRQSTVDGKAGTVFYQVIYNRQMARINTDIHLLPCDWQKVNNLANGNDDYLMLVRKQIDSDISATRFIAKSCEKSGKTYSAKSIVQLFNTKGNREPFAMDTESLTGEGYETSFFFLMRKRIAILKKDGRKGTAANYTNALNSLSLFANGTDITLPMVNQELMERYESWLKAKGLKRNTISFYMRIPRAVYNLAVRDGLTPQTYPFCHVFTGTDKTPKRAVKDDVIKQIANLDLHANETLQKTRNLFLLSYSLCGMPFVDMAYLKPANIKNGTVTYERRKTGEPISFQLQPIAETIIKMYARKDSPYVLPILTSSDSDEAYRQYRTALVEYNRNLRSLSELLHGNVHLTSYVARHSWATTARQHGYPASAIGKALGHTNERTTQTYLEAIDNEVVDKMNKDVLECLQNISPTRK